MENEKGLTVKEVAARLGLAAVTVRKWCKRGMFPNARLITHGVRYWLIPESDLSGLTERRRPVGRPKKKQQDDANLIVFIDGHEAKRYSTSAKGMSAAAFAAREAANYLGNNDRVKITLNGVDVTRRLLGGGDES